MNCPSVTRLASSTAGWKRQVIRVLFVKAAVKIIRSVHEHGRPQVAHDAYLLFERHALQLEQRGACKEAELVSRQFLRQGAAHAVDFLVSAQRFAERDAGCQVERRGLPRLLGDNVAQEPVRESASATGPVPGGERKLRADEQGAGGLGAVQRDASPVAVEMDPVTEQSARADSVGRLPVRNERRVERVPPARFPPDAARTDVGLDGGKGVLPFVCGGAWETLAARIDDGEEPLRIP